MGFAAFHPFFTRVRRESYFVKCAICTSVRLLREVSPNFPISWISPDRVGFSAWRIGTDMDVKSPELSPTEWLLEPLRSRMRRRLVRGLQDPPITSQQVDIAFRRLHKLSGETVDLDARHKLAAVQATLNEIVERVNLREYELSATASIYQLVVDGIDVIQRFRTEIAPPEQQNESQFSDWVVKSLGSVSHVLFELDNISRSQLLLLAIGFANEIDSKLSLARDCVRIKSSFVKKPGDKASDMAVVCAELIEEQSGPLCRNDLSKLVTFLHEAPSPSVPERSIYTAILLIRHKRFAEGRDEILRLAQQHADSPSATRVFGEIFAALNMGTVDPKKPLGYQRVENRHESARILYSLATYTPLKMELRERCRAALESTVQSLELDHEGETLVEPPLTIRVSELVSSAKALIALDQFHNGNLARALMMFDCAVADFNKRISEAPADHKGEVGQLLALYLTRAAVAVLDMPEESSATIRIADEYVASALQAFSEGGYDPSIFHDLADVMNQIRYARDERAMQGVLSVERSSLQLRLLSRPQ